MSFTRDGFLKKKDKVFLDAAPSKHDLLSLSRITFFSELSLPYTPRNIDKEKNGKNNDVSCQHVPTSHDAHHSVTY